MNTRHLSATAAIVVTAVLSQSCGGPPVSTKPAVSIPYADNSTSTGLYNDVNAYRARLGLPKIERHEGLDRLARNHSEFLRNNRGKFKLSKTGNVSHLGFDGRSAEARVRYGLNQLHENVAAGPRGTSILKLWASSSSHAPALSTKWAYTGVGVVVDSDGMIFATQLYGNPGPSHMALRQAYGGW